MYNSFMYIKKFKTNINVKFLQCWTKRWLIWETISNEFRQEFLLRKQSNSNNRIYIVSQNYIWQWMLIIIWYEIQSMFLIYLSPFIYIFIREKTGFYPLNKSDIFNRLLFSQWKYQKCYFHSEIMFKLLWRHVMHCTQCIKFERNIHSSNN